MAISVLSPATTPALLFADELDATSKRMLLWERADKKLHLLRLPATLRGVGVRERQQLLLLNLPSKMLRSSKAKAVDGLHPTRRKTSRGSRSKTLQ